MRLKQRLEALEGGGSGATIGELFNLLDREEAGEKVDWSAVRVEPALAASLDALA